MTPERCAVTLVESAENPYGILYKSVFVYRTSKSSAPTRIVVWGNFSRPNPRDGKSVRWGDYGRLDGGNGRYLDPENNATDNLITVLLTTESSVIDAYGTGTGSVGSGQVFAEPVVTEGSVITLTYPDGVASRDYRVEFTGNGHGRLIPIDEV